MGNHYLPVGDLATIRPEGSRSDATTIGLKSTSPLGLALRTAGLRPTSPFWERRHRRAEAPVDSVDCGRGIRWS